MEATSDIGFSGGLESIHIPAIDGPLPGSETAEQNASTETSETTEQVAEQSSETTEQQTQEQETESTEQPSYSKDPVLNELIAKFAKDHPQLDPANPDHLKILNRMANQEKYIRGLKAKVAQTQDGLTEFERKTLASEAPAAETKQATTETKLVTDAGDDIGAKWTKPEDAITELGEAWIKGDVAMVNRIELGILKRRANALGFLTQSQAKEMVEQEIQERLGDVLPRVRENVQKERTQENKEFALAELEKLSDYAGIRDLEKEIDGEPLLFEGQRFPNTPLNRILMEHPEILDINVRHEDPDTADRLTYFARFRMAYRISKSGQIDAGKAKQILTAATKMAERSSNDRTRQALNSGSGATGLPNGKKTGSFVQDHLLNGEGSTSSFSSL